MNFAAIRREVVRRLAENGTRVFFSSDDVDDAIQAGYMELSDATEWHEGHVDVDLLTDRPYYDCRSVVGAGFLAIRQAFDYQTNRWLLPTSVRQFDAHDRRWERVTGEPQRMLFRGLWWVGYWPRIQSQTGRIKQYYVDLPAPLEHDEDVPGFPDTFHYGLVDYALTELWASDGETAFALAAWQGYLETEAKLAAWVQRRAQAARRPSMGAITRGLPC